MQIIRNQDIMCSPQGEHEAMCVTTNGCIRNDGHAVMGRGIAKTVNDAFHVSLALARSLRAVGNHVAHLGLHTTDAIVPPFHLFSFPTKTDWRNPSSIDLIRQSATELVKACDEYGIRRCYLTPPGCGCGGLDYYHDVHPVINAILDDRFVVILP